MCLVCRCFCKECRGLVVGRICSLWIEIVRSSCICLGFHNCMVLLVFIVGVLAHNFIGRKVMQAWDSLLNRIPVVRGLYNGVKQVSDTLFSENGNAFREAVLVQYPRADVWTIAFVTGKPNGEVGKLLAAEGMDELVGVYVPTTPNPTSGFFLMMTRKDVRALHMSVDEALKYVISMGVVAPAPEPTDAVTDPANPAAAAARN